MDKKLDPSWGRIDVPVDILVRAYHPELDKSPKQTVACIDSIRRNTPEGTYRLIIVCSPVVHHLAKRFGDATIVFVPEHYGCVRMWNLGMAISYCMEAEYLCVMDNDVEIPDGQDNWLTHLWRYLEEEPEIACVGAMSDAAGNNQYVENMPPVYVEAWRNKETAEGGNEGYFCAPFIKAFCAMYRKDDLRAIRRPDSVLDENFEPGGGEDIDLCIRLRQLDNRAFCCIAQDVMVHHKQGFTFDQFVDYPNLVEQNTVKMRQKYKKKMLADMGIQL